MDTAALPAPLPAQSRVITHFLPLYPGWQLEMVELVILDPSKSVLVRNRITEVSRNHLVLQIQSSNVNDSYIRFWGNGKHKIFTPTIFH